MKELLSILIIEADTDDLHFLISSLNRLKVKEIETQIKVASSLAEAMKAFNDHAYDLIITDLFLSDSQGIDTLLEIQKKSGVIPIIIVGRYADEDLVREAIKLGAQDYLPKSDLNADLFSRTIHYAIERHRLHESLRALSFTDELTGLYNRRGFFTLIEQQMSLSKRVKKGFYLFLIDLDRLKQINDTYGHLTGDRALIDTAHCLHASFRRHDIIGRIGGDEFAIVAINTDLESGDYLKRHMVEKMNDYNKQTQEPYQLSFSIGRAYYDGIQEITLDELLQQADSELYQEKRLTH